MSGYHPVRARPEVTGGHIAVAWVVAVLTGFYMLPWAVAATRQKSNTATIALIDALLGWTGIGWIVALVMSLLPERPAYVLTAPTPTTAPPGWYPDGTGVQRWWDGVRWTEHTA